MFPLARLPFNSTIISCAEGLAPTTSTTTTACDLGETSNRAMLQKRLLKIKTSIKMVTVKHKVVIKAYNNHS